MRFSVYIDWILNEKNGSFHIEILISAAHMLGGMLPCEKNLKKCAISCVLVNILIRFSIKFCIEQYDIIMLMGFQGISPMNKHEI